MKLKIGASVLLIALIGSMSQCDSAVEIRDADIVFQKATPDGSKIIISRSGVHSLTEKELISHYPNMNYVPGLYYYNEYIYTIWPVGASHPRVIWRPGYHILEEGVSGLAYSRIYDASVVLDKLVVIQQLGYATVAYLIPINLYRETPRNKVIQSPFLFVRWDSHPIAVKKARIEEPGGLGEFSIILECKDDDYSGPVGYTERTFRLTDRSHRIHYWNKGWHEIAFDKEMADHHWLTAAWQDMTHDNAVVAKRNEEFENRHRGESNISIPTHYDFCVLVRSTKEKEPTVLWRHEEYIESPFPSGWEKEYVTLDASFDSDAVVVLRKHKTRTIAYIVRPDPGGDPTKAKLEAENELFWDSRDDDNSETVCLPLGSWVERKRLGPWVKRGRIEGTIKQGDLSVVLEVRDLVRFRDDESESIKEYRRYLWHEGKWNEAPTTQPATNPNDSLLK